MTWQYVTLRYFPPPYDLQDLFYPSALAPAARATAFLSLLHRILESPHFLGDFEGDKPSPVLLHPPIDLDPSSPANASTSTSTMTAPGQANVDSAEELDYAARMKEVREGVVRLVPAILARDEAVNARQRKQEEKMAREAAEG